VRMDVLLRGGLTKNIMNEVISFNDLTSDTFLSGDVLVKLEFEYDGDSWYHLDEDLFVVKFEDSYYFVYYHGYKAQMKIFTVIYYIKKKNQINRASFLNYCFLQWWV
jgi:hypothetical protein